MIQWYTSTAGSASVSLSPRLCTRLPGVSDLGARRWLRSSSTSALVAPRTVSATIGDRAFPAAAASVWNSLLETVRSSPSLPVFRRRLKTELFVRSYSCSASWTSHCTDWLLCDPTLLLRVLAVLGLYATSSLFVIIIIIYLFYLNGRFQFPRSTSLLLQSILFLCFSAGFFCAFTF